MYTCCQPLGDKCRLFNLTDIYSKTNQKRKCRNVVQLRMGQTLCLLCGAFPIAITVKVVTDGPSITHLGRLLQDFGQRFLKRACAE